MFFNTIIIVEVFMRRKLVICNAWHPYCPPSSKEMRKIELKYNDSECLYVWYSDLYDAYYFWNMLHSTWMLIDL